MFDDKPTNQNQSSDQNQPTNQNQQSSQNQPSSAPPGSAGGHAPVNLPIGGAPKPVSAGLPPPAPGPEKPQMPQEKEPEDILAAIDKDEDNVRGPAKPIASLPAKPKGPTPPAVKPPEKPVSKEPFFKEKKKVIVVAVIVILAGAILGVGGWYGYNLLVSEKSASAPALTNTGQVQPPVNTNQVDGGNINIPDPNEVPEPIDSDRDGLTDEDEAKYGTDPRKVDTDTDGLTDRDEVKVFETDPNNSDTDGDTYLDGDEVRAGYDPKGPGRLLRVE